MDKDKTLKAIEGMIEKLDGAAGRMIVTAMGGNKEIMEAMDMVTDVNVALGEMAEAIEMEENDGTISMEV